MSKTELYLEDVTKSELFEDRDFPTTAGRVSKAFVAYEKVIREAEYLMRHPLLRMYYGGPFEDGTDALLGACHGYPDLYDTPKQNPTTIDMILRSKTPVTDMICQSHLTSKVPESDLMTYDGRRLRSFDEWVTLFDKYGFTKYDQFSDEVFEFNSMLAVAEQFRANDELTTEFGPGGKTFQDLFSEA